jgi:16S rRNA (adenine1518-N6/adenine1519-N6)-dimethyltransferase
MKFAKKSLGQNFLIDKNIIKKIINLTTIKNKNIIEIGPGKGALTEEILKLKPRSLIAIEKDTLLSNDLKIKYSKEKNVIIYNKDILKFDIEKICKRNTIIFGNLPYNISSQILVKIIKHKKWPPKFQDLILMFQKELAERIIGAYKTKSYGRLSILTNLRLSIHKQFLVSPNCFVPKPKINSLVIQFKPKKKFTAIKNISNLEKITNILFSNKRKMINKNIKKILNKKQLNQISDLKMNLRPSEIEQEIYYNITEIYEKGQ